ncbi:MAG TPA: glycerol kinase GlpK [Planctomycetota bacterium]
MILAVDAGTTGISAIAVDARGRQIRRAYAEIKQIYPRPGWVEHDPMEIWAKTRDLLRRVARKDVVALGLTNQRETTVVWDRRTGRPVSNAIVWQCRRTSDRCDALRSRAPAIRRTTGLVVDAYFSATKLEWILKHVRPRGDLAFGTIDSWLLWNLTGLHATDVTNASRTMLFDIDRRRWDPGLLRTFGVPASMLPEVRTSTSSFGTTSLLGREIPVTGVAGDQQAALFGQGCARPGAMKNTYGTGGFLMVNTGARRRDSRSGLLTTLACGPRGETVYALEGAVFIAGAAVQYLRDALGLIRNAAETETLARSVPSTGGVYFVPAFVGLGAPYWDMRARGAIVGLTRGSGRAEIARAALEAIAYQTRDMIDASGVKVRDLRVDGGATSNDFLMQFQADLLGARIVRPKTLGATALGAAYLAGIGAGLWRSRDELPVDVDRVFEPRMSRRDAAALHAGWKAAVRRVRLPING